MKAINNTINRYGLIMIIFILITSFISSCNKDVPNILKKQSEQADYESASSKVLYIIVDGVRGKALPSIDMKNLNIISRNSIYSVGSLSDFEKTPITKEAGITSLLTGVVSSKHKVTDADLSKADLGQYPSILSRINKTASNIQSAAFTSNDDISKALFKDADSKEILKNDSEVLNRTIQEIKSGSSDFTVCHFTEPYIVGTSNSFEIDNNAYVASLLKIDEYLGSLINEVKSRPNYQRENWLVVITSSIGGAIKRTEADDTFYGDDEKNTFTYIYSPRFTRSVLSRPNSTQIPFDGSAVKYVYNGRQVNATAADASLYSFGNSTDDFSINFFIKTNTNDNTNYPVILSKRIRGFQSDGWNLFFEVRDGNNKIGWNSSISDQVFGTKRINDGVWHSFTVTVHRSGDNDTVKVYTDGVFNAKVGMKANTTLRNDAPLVIGRRIGDDNDRPNFLMANLQIYDKALTAKEIADFSGVAVLDDTYPVWENLVGYWPGYQDIGTNKLTDATNYKNDLTLSGDWSWQSFSDIVNYFKPQITPSFYKLVPNAVDHPFFIYQWFGIIARSEWQLDGKSWTPSLIVSSNQ
jgi:hypothetical protein